MTARIYQPSRAATQSGLGKTREWILEHEPATRRAPESLMGWTSAADALNQIRLRFPSRDDAVAYAERHGLAYDIQDTNPRTVRPRSYTDRFRPLRNH
ncbi:MAG: ETC complex I subunit [Rhodospirillaceae bacterium]